MAGPIEKQFTKPGVNARLMKRGGPPRFQDLYAKLMASSTDEITRLTKKLAQAARTGDRAAYEAARRQVALGVQEICVMIMLLHFGSRRRDITHALKKSDLRHLTPELILVNYLPSKTSGNDKPSEVDACLPGWFVHLFDLYLERYHAVIYPGAELLFPADIERKKVHAYVAHDGEARNGNIAGWIARKTAKYFGTPNQCNMFRKSLTTLFDVQGLHGVHLFTGHRDKNSTLTPIEREHYSVISDKSRIDRARNSDQMIQRLVELNDDQIADFKSVVEALRKVETAKRSSPA